MSFEAALIAATVLLVVVTLGLVLETRWMRRDAVRPLLVFAA